MDDLRIVVAGDAALVVELPARIDPAINGRLVSIADRLRTCCGSAILDAVVAYCTLTVYFDPMLVDAGWLEGELRAIAEEDETSAEADGAEIEVPVCYGGELGPDLASVAREIGATADEVIALHCAPEYRVYMVGFVPGFAYMGVVDPRLALPRLARPRTRVPSGSVAIAAGQTGVYPKETPGGWHLLGRTPVRPFDATRAEPVLFKAGDRVRFHPIDRAAFDRASEF
ncbi:MAG TPA: 5-oxoprolinase subunit PxpB [Vicinamibacterales bacterium]|nr:5-oxoprolinase subunit PxpB [Vicinamibacterales bacterium]